MRSIRREYRAMLVIAGINLSLVAQAFSQQPTDAQDLQVILEMLPLKKQLDELSQAGRYKEAEALAKQMLARAEQVFSHRPEFVVPFLNNLAVAYTNQGRLPEAEALQARVVATMEQTYGLDTPATTVARRNLAGVRVAVGRYTEAGVELTRVLQNHQRQPIFDDFGLSAIWNELGLVHFNLGQYAQAETEHRYALALMGRARGADDPELAGPLNNLAGDLEITQRLAEAETMYRRALDLNRKRYGLENPNAATYLGNLARVIASQGRHAEAESLQKQAVTIVEKVQGPDSLAAATALGNLVIFYLGQNREIEVEPILVRIVTIYDRAGVPEHPSLADPITVLALLRLKAGRLAEADGLFRRALAIREKTWGPEHPQIIFALFSQAMSYLSEGGAITRRLAPLFVAIDFWDSLDRPGARHVRFRPLANLAVAWFVRLEFLRAEALLRRALAIQERVWGVDQPASAFLLSMIAQVVYWTGRFDEVVLLQNRAIAIGERAGTLPGLLAHYYQSRARALWAKSRRVEALADLHRAMDLAEEDRSRGAGGEFDQARQFGMQADVFDQMMAFQAEGGDAREALIATERGRARALLDRIESQGTDLLAGVSSTQAAELRRSRDQARTDLSASTARLNALERSPGPFGPEKRQTANALRSEINQARLRLIEADRAIHNASPAARLTRSADRNSVAFDRLRATLARSGSLLLEYNVDDLGGYVLVVPGSSAPARVESLTVSAAAARRLGGFPAPLFESRLQEILVGSQGDGVLPRLSRQDGPGTPDARLAVLWEILIPEPERRDLLSGRYRKLVVVPDAALALLPFEALVVEEGKETKFLLDSGPPILYIPSATLLQNLIDRPAMGKTTDREPVLAVGDPAYGEAGAADPSPASTLAARSRYSSVGGRLGRLPFSGAEMRSVVKDFSDAGISAASLSGASATERGVRYWSSGRRVLHLACHGLADQQYGNFFGALALTPGPKGAENSADDGFLTLPEIYELNLKGCELAILSACETNYGPQQKGEGTWALSRGFLVAGSRRVVASNWLVDDEAAASLVSYFCAGLAQAEKSGKPADHAAALQAAKRYIRQQEKWKSPYYWASMVLIGPP